MKNQVYLKNQEKQEKIPSYRVYVVNSAISMYLEGGQQRQKAIDFMSLMPDDYQELFEMTLDMIFQAREQIRDIMKVS